jgi:hypothetical protein
LFPLNEDVTPQDVDRWLQGLHDGGLICRYEVDGKRYLRVIGWDEKQSPRHPTPSKLPPMPDSYGDPPQHDREVPEDRADPPHGVEVGDGVGEGEGVGGVELALVSPPATVTIDPVDAVFGAWQEHTGHHKAARTPDRVKRIREALKHYPVEDLVDACRGVHLSAHHRGENERNTVYDDIEHVLKNSKNIETFRDLARGQANAPPRLPQGAEMVRRAVARAGGNQ